MLINQLSRAMLTLGTAMAASFAAMPSMALAADEGVPGILPPMSVPTAHYYSTHPDALASLVRQLHRAVPAKAHFTTPSGGTWSAVSKGPRGLTSPLLLTDGTVLAAQGNTPYWWRLTPDNSGNYATGTWTQAASLPVVNGTQYAPLYHASAVLPDGRVIIMGGEYDGKNHGVWTNAGAIYDPVANTWTAVNPPPGTQWGQIGDAQSVVLDSGIFMLAACCSYDPPADALLNANKLSWTHTGAPRFGGQYQDEQGYELLPSGKVLTIDIWTTYPTGNNPTNTELYNPRTRRWMRGADTPVSLVDPEQCGNYEIGPAPLRGDGTLVAFGGNTGCVAGATTDPTAVYDTKANSWIQGPDIPSVCGSDGATPCDLADAPAAVLPDGNILFGASSGYGQPPTHFFEFSSSNTIAQVSDPLNHSTNQGAYTYFFLVLPSGQILSTDFSTEAEVYTSPGTPVSAWAPVIYHAPSTVTAGKTYKLVGAQLNGRTAGAYYGDDAQMATNYPIVRFTNTTTGHVFYGRTVNPSGMGVAAGTLGSVSFAAPSGIETGASTMVVVANGIASKPVLVTVK